MYVGERQLLHFWKKYKNCKFPVLDCAVLNSLLDADELLHSTQIF
jgi:hypothetical protein